MGEELGIFPSPRAYIRVPDPIYRYISSYFFIFLHNEGIIFDFFLHIFHIFLHIYYIEEFRNMGGFFSAYVAHLHDGILERDPFISQFAKQKFFIPGNISQRKNYEGTRLLPYLDSISFSVII